jgi:hypothetical protein
MCLALLLAQGTFPINSIVQLLIIVIVVGAIWYIFTNLVALPPKVMMVIKVIAIAVLAIFAIKFLASLM